CNRFDEIDFGQLPEKFVIKANHGTHWILVVEDKKALDKAGGRRLVDGWMKTNYYVNSREIFYRDVKPQIMVEEDLEEESGPAVIDYKCYAFDGVTRFIAVAWRRTVTSSREAALFDRDLREIPAQVEFGNSAYKRGQHAIAAPRPAMPPNIARMMEI